MKLDHNIRKTIARYAKDFPDKIVLHDSYENITYAELHLRIDHLSQLLQVVGIKKGDVVAVCIPSSIEMIISIYAILYTRAIVLPIDIDSPLERINIIFSKIQPALVLCRGEMQNDIEQFNVKCMAVDSIFPKTNEGVVDHSLYDISEDDYGFCLYTSGTTATPKGVLLSYKGILNHASAKCGLLQLTQNSKLCLSFNIGFVASIWQILVPILIGAELFIYDKYLVKKPYEFFKQLEVDSISAISVTPHTLKSYLEYIKVKKHKLELCSIAYVILTGEKISGLLVGEFYDNYASITLINAYGQTECSDDTYHYVIPRSFNEVHVPIGAPIDGITGFVLKDDYTESDVGELFIGGIGVASGYISNEELTDIKFIKLQLFNTTLYRTGDWVRKQEDGNLIYLGRVDNQVKIRGYRVELEEIETYINQVNGIIQSVVIAVETSETEKRLEAFYTSIESIEKQVIIDYISKKLPTYMIPSIFKRVEKFNITANGKIDRKGVWECIEAGLSIDDSKQNNKNQLSDFQTKVFKVIISHFNEKNVNNISINTDITAVDIDSINFINMVIALESEFDFEFDDEMLLITQFPSFKSLIDYVESKII